MEQYEENNTEMESWIPNIDTEAAIDKMLDFGMDEE